MRERKEVRREESERKREQRVVGRRFSLVVEHLSCKQKVKGSIPLVAFCEFCSEEVGRHKTEKKEERGKRRKEDREREEKE